MNKDLTSVKTKDHLYLTLSNEPPVHKKRPRLQLGIFEYSISDDTYCTTKCGLYLLQLTSNKIPPYLGAYL